jgi:hypothetical protein
MRYPIIEAGTTTRDHQNRRIVTEYVTGVFGGRGDVIVALETRHDKARRTYRTTLTAGQRVQRNGYYYDTHTMREDPSVLLDVVDAGARFSQARLGQAHRRAAREMVELLGSAPDNAHAVRLHELLTAQHAVA